MAASSTLVHVAYPVTSAVVLLFGGFAMAVGYFHFKRQGKDTTEFFLTARNSAGLFRIAFSMYAGGLGSWALFSAPSYAYTAGVLGVVFYALAAGLPYLIIGYLGVEIQKKIPRVYSFSDYLQRRFGRVVQVYISTVMLVTMGTALTVEYTTVGAVFTQIIGTTQIPIIIIIGIVSSVYTAYGGLHVSLITDQVQASFTLILLVLLYLWVAAKFRPPGGLGPLPTGPDETHPLRPNLSASNHVGLSSICSMPVSIICASFFSEGPWQRCWASASHKTLRRGAAIGAVLICFVVFLTGFGGLLAAWSGYFVPKDPDDFGNTVLFTLLANSVGAVTPTVWITTVVACLSVTMSTSAVDNHQNAIADNIAGVFLKNYSVWWARLLVLALNVPCIIVSLRNYNVINLFLMTNILNSTAAIPVMLGLWKSSLAYKIVTPASVLFGCLLGLLSVVLYGIIQAPHWHLSATDGIHQVFLGLYDWPPFVIAPGFSTIGVLLMAGFENLIGKQLLGQTTLEEIQAAAVADEKSLPESLRASDFNATKPGSITIKAIP